MNLIDLGWDDFFASAFSVASQPGQTPARVVTQFRGAVQIVGANGDLMAEVSGRFRHHATTPAAFPVTGDWVAAEEVLEERKAIIHAVLPRRTKFSRTAAGEVTEEQVVAANVDELFVMAALSSELNLRRIERYLALACESGATPIVVLTKADVCDDVSSAVESIQGVLPGVAVHAISSVTGFGMRGLKKHLKRGRTIALLGPSGVGKSTLVNHLCDEEILAAQEVREGDDKGRHTTTRREMIPLPSGALVIDTPGMRELQLWEGEEGIVGAFADIDVIAARCRFSDCSHEREPGCAVREAVESEELDAARLASFQKLRREEASFERRHNIRAQSEEKRRWKVISRSLRANKKPRDEEH